ncbi:hypothetical protein AB0J35_40095 [Nonomuraea angiospora]|uniref:hypothetical protein n=1 Tax=Nonomuraea angiospora TaxID=46172 RepID=UPI00342D765A
MPKDPSRHWPIVWSCTRKRGPVGSPGEASPYPPFHGVALLERAAASPPFPSEGREVRRVNPKRAAKLAARAAAEVSRRSTASQEALRLELESRRNR